MLSKLSLNILALTSLVMATNETTSTSAGQNLQGITYTLTLTLSLLLLLLLLLFLFFWAGIDSYGNWCGGGHGGLQDCCSGGRCQSCDFHKGVTAACLSQCPAVVSQLVRQSARREGNDWSLVQLHPCFLYALRLTMCIQKHAAPSNPSSLYSFECMYSGWLLTEFRMTSTWLVQIMTSVHFNTTIMILFPASHKETIVNATASW